MQVSGCEGSGMMMAFHEHLMQRLNIPQEPITVRAHIPLIFGDNTTAVLHVIAGRQIRSDIAAAYNSTSEDSQCRAGERVIGTTPYSTCIVIVLQHPPAAG